MIIIYYINFYKKILKMNKDNTILLVICLYSLLLSLYSCYVLYSNIPLKELNEFYITSYVVCIVNTLLYISVIVLFLNIKDKERKNYNIEIIYAVISIVLNIYWLIVILNYKIPESFYAYSIIKTTEFFMIILTLIINIIIVLPCILLKKFRNNNIINNEQTITSV